MTSPDTTAADSEPVITQQGSRALLNFFKTARTHYLNQYRSFIEHQRETGRAGEGEVLLETDDVRLLDGLLVADYGFTGPEDASVIRFEPTRGLQFNPVEVALNGAEIIIERLRWDEVVITTDTPLPDADRLRPWFRAFLQPQDVPEDQHEPLANVLHSVAFDDDRLMIDFGSAPTEALFELLLRLIKGGAKHIQLI